MDIHITKEKMTIHSNKKIVKQVDLTKESFGEYMRELSGYRVDMIREATRLFKCKSYRFKDVKL